MASRTDQKKQTELTIQQRESLQFFEDKARDWEAKAQGKLKYKVNVIAQRNEYVLHVLDKREATVFALDVGSGVGDLVCAMAERGVKATGIDIAGGMVDLAHRRAAASKLAMAKFIHTDYFDYHVADASYDLVSANGFLEYVSFSQRDDFLKDAHRILTPGGSLLVSSRNRLFNLFSNNSYSELELTLGAVEALLREAVALVSGDKVERLLQLEAAALQPEDVTHDDTGIDVSTRYQYTPVQLMKMLQEAGFEIAGVSPIHVHAGAPAFKADHPDVHYETANLLQTFAIENRTLLPNSSAFMVHARKR